MNRLVLEAQNKTALGERFERVWKHPTMDVLQYRSVDGTRFFIDTRPLDQGRDPLVTSRSALEFGSNAQMHTKPRGQIELLGRVRYARLSDLFALCDYWAAKAAYFRQTGTFPPDGPFDQIRDSTGRFWERLRTRFRRAPASRSLRIARHGQCVTPQSHERRLM